MADDKQDQREVVVFLATGPNHTRVISRDDWKVVGVDHETVTWSQANEWTVPKSKLHLDDAQFHEFIMMDSGFRVRTEG